MSIYRVLLALATLFSSFAAAQTPLQIFGDYSYDSRIAKLKGRFITTGCQTNPALYCPNDTFTRGQAAVMIIRALYSKQSGNSEGFPDPTAVSFADVLSTHPQHRWIQKMLEFGISTGCGGGLFCPDGSFTFKQLAVFIVRARRIATGQPASDPPACEEIYPFSPNQVYCDGTLNRFADIPATDWGYLYAEQVYAWLGSAAACGPTWFCADDPVTRASAALFLVDGILGTNPPPALVPKKTQTAATPTCGTTTGATPTFLSVNTFIRLPDGNTYSKVEFRENPDTPLTSPELWALSVKGDYYTGGAYPSKSAHAEAYGAGQMVAYPITQSQPITWTQGLNGSQNVTTQINSLCVLATGENTTTNAPAHNVPYVVYLNDLPTTSQITLSGAGATITLKGSFPDWGGSLNQLRMVAASGSEPDYTASFSSINATQATITLPGNKTGAYTLYAEVQSGGQWVAGTGVQILIPGAAVTRTITTNPTGLKVSVDGAPEAVAPLSFSGWATALGHTLSVSSPQPGTTGSQYVYTGWSDGGAQSHQIVADATTYTASFKKQHYVTTAVNNSTWGGISPASFWQDEGGTVSITATPYGSNQFSGFTISGGATASGSGLTQTFTITGPATITANFGQGGSVTFLTNPAGLAVTVDGVQQTTPYSPSPAWTIGSSHTISAPTNQGTGARYTFVSWSDAGAQTHSVVAGSGAATYTANFGAAYLLTTSVSGSGSIQVNPTSADGYYAAGMTVNLLAVPVSGQFFSTWSGVDTQSNLTSASVTMSGPRNVTASFTTNTTQYQLTTSVSPPGAGSINPTTGLFNAGPLRVTATPTANSGYAFSGFTGTYSGVANPLDITLSGNGAITANFVPGYIISGQVTMAGTGAAISGASITAIGPQTVTVTSDAAGQYALPLAAGGSYTVVAFKSGYTLSGTRSFANLSANQTASFTATPSLSINGGSNTAEVAPGTNVSMAFSLFRATGANDITRGLFYFSDSAGNANCVGEWERPNKLFLYGGDTGPTEGYGISQRDAFCTVSLISITNSATDPTQVTVVLNFSFAPGPGGTYTVLAAIDEPSGEPGPWEGVGTLTIEPGVTISGHLTALDYPLVGTTVTLSGSSSATTVTDSFGAYSFAQTAGRSYTIVPSAAGMVFTPPSRSWNNITTNQTGDFTALPSGYEEGSGPTSIPNSYTAADPVLTCDDISGVWDEADQFGNHNGWNLSQAGTSISGQMSFLSIRNGVNCGQVIYDVTGSHNAGSASFSLSATIHGSAFDGCGQPVVPTAAESVTLSGRACGDGSGVFTPNSTSVAASLPALGFNSASHIAGTTQLMSATLHNSGTSGAFSSGGGLQPRNAPVSTSWTTISPRFTIQYSAYIPVDHIPGPTPCLASLPFGLLNYKGDAFRNTYRATESILVVPSVQKYGNLFARGGPTRNYQIPSSPANGLNLQSTPTGDVWKDPYTGADEDEKRFDCHLWHDKGEALKDGMQGLGITWGNPVTQVTLYGVGQDPLEPKVGGIKWNLTVSLDTTDPANPKAWVSGGTATCYPAHIVKVNGVKVFERIPSQGQNNTGWLTGCLSIPGTSVTPSTPTVVPKN